MTRAEFSARLDALQTEHGAAGCWPWPGGRNLRGYGQVRYEGRQLGAHRVAAHVVLGMPLERESHALHRCDNPPCVNPAHLFVGDHSDNMSDCVAKGRHRSGRGSRRVLTAEQTAAARESRAAGFSVRTIAKAFDVSYRTLYRALSGEVRSSRKEARADA